MKTNRRKYRTLDRYGDCLYTKRQANKRNRRDAKKSVDTYQKMCYNKYIIKKKEVHELWQQYLRLRETRKQFMVSRQ